MDSRMEKFRQARLLKRKCKLVFLFSIILLILGICVTDYSVNVLVKNEKKISLLSFSKQEDYYYKASFLNMHFYVNTRKLGSDFINIRNKAENFISSIDLF